MKLLKVFQGYLSFVRKSDGCRFKTWLGDKAVRFEEKAAVVAWSKSVLFIDKLLIHILL